MTVKTYFLRQEITHVWLTLWWHIVLYSRHKTQPHGIQAHTQQIFASLGNAIVSQHSKSQNCRSCYVVLCVVVVFFSIRVSINVTFCVLASRSVVWLFSMCSVSVKLNSHFGSAPCNWGGHCSRHIKQRPPRLDTHTKDIRCVPVATVIIQVKLCKPRKVRL